MPEGHEQTQACLRSRQGKRDHMRKICDHKLHFLRAFRCSAANARFVTRDLAEKTAIHLL
jgi:hypothetical protein